MSEKDLQFVIVTGLSGAGKSLASRCLEDFGFFCVDNLPPALIPTFAELCIRSRGEMQKVALVIDIRGGEFFGDIFPSLERLQQLGVSHRILFLDSDDETLVHRFKETRRRHPLATDSDNELLELINREREALLEIKERADKIIDTTKVTPRELRDEIAAVFVGDETGQMHVHVVSFGFKYGIPLDADLVQDVRFLINPNYVREMSHLDGTYEKVSRYVLEHNETREFLNHLWVFLGYLLPRYVEEGKTYLSIAVGCTGGRHRSVVMANSICNFLKGKGYAVTVHHRDIHREWPGGTSEKSQETSESRVVAS
jgi:UPF0042 nucleotide-binding protein